jgi:hypothetical protein
MMDKEKINAAVIEAKVFIEACETAMKHKYTGGVRFPIDDPIAVLRRKSMGLTRVLAELRKS